MRRDAHDAEERPVYRHDYAACNFGSLRIAIDWNHALPERRKLLGQRTLIRALTVVAVIDGELHIEDANFKHITGHRAGDSDRSREYMATGTAIFYLAIDRPHIVRHGAGRDNTRLIDRRRLNGAGAFECNDVAGLHRQHRLECGVEVPYMHSLRTRHQRVFALPPCIRTRQ